MNSNIVPNSFVAISDFHSTRYPLEKVTNYYINEYDKIFILGDATDRGKNGIGYGGVKLLEDIKKLCDQYPNRVVYIPGNHDTFLYEYGMFNDLHSLRSQEQFDTISYVKFLKEKDPNRLNSLMTWLGNLPIQRVHEFDGKKFVFAHAFFNQNLYKENPNYSLKMMYEIQKQQTAESNKKYKKLYNVLWYRYDEYYDSKDVPGNVIEVIGHTPAHIRQGVNLDLENYFGGITKVFCVDGGVTFGYDMLKYDGKDEVLGTPFFQHTDTSPKNLSEYNTNDDRGLSILINGINETTSRHGIANMRLILGDILHHEPDWYIYFSRGHRDEVGALGGERAYRIIKNYSKSNSKNIEDIINNFLSRLYEENGEFKKIIDEEKSIYTPVLSSDSSTDQTDDLEKRPKHFKKSLLDDMGAGLVDSTVYSDDTNFGDAVTLKENVSDFDYVALYSGDRLVVIYRVNDDQIEAFINMLKKQYGEDVIQNSISFDYNTLINAMEPGESVALEDTGYTTFMNKNGDIIVLNENGNVVYYFDSIGSFENVKVF